MVGSSDVDSYFTIRGPLPSRSDPRHSLFPEPVHSQRRFHSTSHLPQYHNRGFLSHHPQDSRRCPVSLRMARWSCICRPIWMSVVFYFHLTPAYLRSPDITVSISSLFPVVYGTLYHFNPSKQGLLYLPMLVGSLLAECGTGRVGDKLVSSDFSCPLGVLTIIEKRNAKYAAGKRAGGAESTTSVTVIPPQGDDVRSDSTKVPETRLVLALLGSFFCIVGGL